MGPQSGGFTWIYLIKKYRNHPIYLIRYRHPSFQDGKAPSIYSLEPRLSGEGTDEMPDCQAAAEGSGHLSLHGALGDQLGVTGMVGMVGPHTDLCEDPIVVWGYFLDAKKSPKLRVLTGPGDRF